MNTQQEEETKCPNGGDCKCEGKYHDGGKRCKRCKRRDSCGSFNCFMHEEVVIFSCDICYEETKTKEKITLECKHDMCRICYDKIKTNGEIKCPSCRLITLDYKELYEEYKNINEDNFMEITELKIRIKEQRDIIILIRSENTRLQNIIKIKDKILTDNNKLVKEYEKKTMYDRMLDTNVRKIENNQPGRIRMRNIGI